jgi:hypothetical protein
VLGVALPLCRRGIVVSDEGYLLMQALDLRDGKLLYRDMDAFVSPGVWLLLAALFSWVEPSVIASRGLALTGFAITLVLVHRIARSQAGPGAGLVAVCAMAVGCVWAFPVWTFVFYSPFAVLLALAALERLLAWQRTGRSADLFLTGLLCGGAIAFKQNYGALALAGCAASVVGLRWLVGVRAVSHQPLRTLAVDGVWLGSGVAAALLPIVAYFTAMGALPDLLDSLVLHPLEFGARSDIPYLPLSTLWHGEFMQRGGGYTYAATPLHHVGPIFPWLESSAVSVWMHVFLYWIPPLVFVSAGWMALRRRDTGLFCVSAVCGSLFLGVLPRADFNHLINVYQGVVLTSVLLATRGGAGAPDSSWARPRLGVRVVASTLLLVYAMVAVQWYSGLVGTMNTKLAVDRGGVLLEPFEAMLLEDVVALMRERDGAVLTVPDLSMLNFLSGRPVPGAYYNMYEHHLAHDRGAGVVEDAEAAEVTLALVGYDDFMSDRIGLREYAPMLVDYLRDAFELTHTIGDQRYLLLERRSAPRREKRLVDALTACELGSRGQLVRSHLLFDALYQSTPTDARASAVGVEARCRVRVPDQGAELRMGVDYRGRATRGSPPQAVEVWIAGPDGRARERVLARRFLPWREPGWRHRLPLAEQRVDLGAWAGSEIVLILRSLPRVDDRNLGRAAVPGISVVWRDVRLVAPPVPGLEGEAS